MLRLATIIAFSFVLTTGSVNTVVAQEPYRTMGPETQSAQRRVKERQTSAAKLQREIIQAMLGHRASHPGNQEVEIEVRKKKRPSNSSGRNDGDRSSRGKRGKRTESSGGNRKKRGRKKAEREGRYEGRRGHGRAGNDHQGRGHRSKKRGADSRSRRESTKRGPQSERRKNGRSGKHRLRGDRKNKRARRGDADQGKRGKRRPRNQSGQWESRPGKPKERSRNSNKNLTSDIKNSLDKLDRRISSLENGFKAANKKQSYRIEQLEQVIERMLKKKR